MMITSIVLVGIVSVNSSIAQMHQMSLFLFYFLILFFKTSPLAVKKFISKKRSNNNFITILSFQIYNTKNFLCSENFLQA